MKLYYLSDIEGEFMTLWVTDVEAKEHEEILAFSWDIIAGRISENGKAPLLIVNRDGFSELHIIDTKDSSPRCLPLRRAALFTINASARTAASCTIFVTRRHHLPISLRIDLETKETEQLTDSMSDEVNSNDLSEAKVLRFISYDGPPSAWYFIRLEMFRQTRKPLLLYGFTETGRSVSAEIQS